MPARTPEECDILFGEYVNAGDVASLLELYEDQATLVGPDGSVAQGKAAIAAAFAATALEGAVISTQVTQQFCGGDIALLFNDWSLTASDPNGAPVKMAFGAIEVVRRQPDGTWRFVIDHPYAIARQPAD